MEHSRYIIQNTYHNHSHYCDGKDSLEAMIQSAISLGFTSFGFSSHAAVPFENPWSIVSMEAFDNYIADINCLQKKYSKDIQLFRGLEADYIPDIFTLPGKTVFPENRLTKYLTKTVYGGSGTIWYRKDFMPNT